VKIAIIGAGWAGLAAAVSATQAGHTATVFEATHAIGGRARSLNGLKKYGLPDGTPVTLDNGQHILIGAYTDTLSLMRLVGINPDDALLSLPMTLQFPDGLGLRFTAWPTPLDALGGILSAHGWTVADKWALLRAAVGWQLKNFTCDAALSVAQLCQNLTPKVNTELIEPLCVSALNTPAARASAQVFLRVLRDALFGVQGGSRLLLPKVDLGALFPAAAATWLQRQGGHIHIGQRVQTLETEDAGWRVGTDLFDTVILATSASNVLPVLMDSAQEATTSIAKKIQQWIASCQALQFEAIATVYAWAPKATLPQPMIALRNSAAHPAQFVFDKGQLGGPAGLLAFVVSASDSDRATLEAQVLSQAQTQLGLTLQAVQTVVEKRATFACTPGLTRPPMHIAPGLLACGDYVEGPYPATLEGAVRSGLAAVAGLEPARQAQGH
jgi:squalene-associated FAD-dependent desaturase